MIVLASFLTLIGMLVFIVGGFAAFGVFAYGIYVAIFESVATGLMLIGASMVATFVARLAHGLVQTLAEALLHSYAQRELSKEDV